MKKGTHVLVRSTNAGVFVGKLEGYTDTTVTLKDARRIWYWEGAATLSQLAMEGVKHPDKCKFPCPVKEITISGWIEIIPMMKKAVKNIKEVPIWPAC